MARHVPHLVVMADLPQPPRLSRRFQDPSRAALLVLALTALPALAMSGQFPREARGSVVNVTLCFVALLLAFRLMGKRELSRLSPFELVTLMLIPEILSNGLQGEGSLLTALSGLCTVLLLVVGVSMLSHRFPAVKTVLESTPTVLVENGKLLEEAMNRERITPDELYGEMRKQSISQLSELRFAVLESGGTITFVTREATGRPRNESEEE